MIKGHCRCDAATLDRVCLRLGDRRVTGENAGCWLTGQDSNARLRPCAEGMQGSEKGVL